MSHQLAVFILISAAVLTIVSAVTGGISIAAHILYRSTLLRREIATRRILGARRFQIVRMLLAENIVGIAVGVLVGGIAVLVVGEQYRPGVAVVIFSAAVVAAMGMCGGWLAARHASKTPSAASGLFQSPPDRRGQSSVW